MKKQVKKKSAATTKKSAGTRAKKKAAKKVEPNTQKPAAKQSNDNKVFDVAKPGASMPSSTTRPIIVTHRPMARDPMVSPQQAGTPAEPSAEAAKPEEAAATYTARAKNNRIEPLSNNVKAGDTEKSEAAEVSEPDKEEAAFSLPLDEKPTLELVKEAEPEEAEKTEEPAESAEPEAKPEESPEATETEAKAPEPDMPAEEAESGESESDASETDQSEDTANAASDDAPKQDDKNEGDMEEVTELAGQAAAKKAQKSAEEEAAKRQAEAEALVEKKTYFVPINAVSKRRTTHVFVVFVVLIVVLAGAVAALDAGLLDIGIELPFDVLPNDLF